MLKKLIGVVAVTTMAFIATVSVASAQTPPAYPPPGHAIACSNIPVFAPGRAIVCSAFTFAPGSDVTFTLFSAPAQLGVVAADAEGVATLDSNIPLDTEPGAHRIEATGVDRFGAALTLVYELVVQVPGEPLPREEPAGGGGGPLPRTGTSSSVPMAQVAVAAIVAGGFLLIMANRRRPAVVTADRQRTRV